jgi:FlaA1/EpsC-like NDP-sugar epimerase
MGATKMIGERLCISRELSKGDYKTMISCVRFGNVLGSRGSIIPLIKKQIEDTAEITLTDEEMTRFFMSVEQAVELVLDATLHAGGGEIFVLRMPIFKILDLFEIIIEEHCKKIGKDVNDIKIKKIGGRVGEKLHESLLFENEYENCFELDDMYVVYPEDYFGNPYITEVLPKIDKNKIIIEPLSKEAVKVFLQYWKII